MAGDSLLPPLDELFDAPELPADALDSMLEVAFDPATPDPEGDLVPSNEMVELEDIGFRGFEEQSADLEELDDLDTGFADPGYDADSPADSADDPLADF